jgi:hypothetical protein
MTAPARNILASLPIACVAGISAAQQCTEAEAFAAHCFSPFLTAETAAECLAPGRVDFYDLRPFSGVNPVSPPMGRPVTPGTDRRCEVAFDGEHVESGMEAIVTGLTQEGILSEATVPADFPAQSGTAFIAARYLNPNRIAVVQVGTRPGPYGTETFINVERLVPLSETSQ